MCPKHVKLNNTTNNIIDDMTDISFDEQIAQLQTKRKAQNKSDSRNDLVRLASSKNVTDAQLLGACYKFIGTHRPVGVRKPKVAV